MINILEKYCLDNSENGLLLLSMPTGFGKTYNVINFIYDNYEKFSSQNRKIFFITNLKKNLPYSDLKKKFEVNNRIEDFKRHVLFIDSNSEGVINNLLCVCNEIPNKLRDKNYRDLYEYVKLAQDKSTNKMLMKNIKNQIRQTFEPRFRQSIVKYIKNEFESKKQSLIAINNRKKYAWIKKLYPAINTENSTVLFLSIDKFIRKNTTLVENSYYFTEKLSKNALIFIDEFDASKERVLNNIIESGMSHRIDMVDLFLKIHNNLTNIQCPEWLLRVSDVTSIKISEGQWKSPHDIINSILEKARNIFTKYNLQYSCKSKRDNFDNQRTFLFHDYQYHNVLDSYNKSIKLKQDLVEKVNWIIKDEISNRDHHINIWTLLSDIGGFLTYFQYGIVYISKNHYQLKQEEISDSIPYSIESSIRTVLNQIGLDKTYVDFLAKNIMEQNLPFQTRVKEQTILQRGFYEEGFRYHDIVDSEDHDSLSRVYMYNFILTPEMFLANLCKNAKVIGMSATATLPTNIGNYDLDFLHYFLGDKYITLEENELQNLRMQYEKSNLGYNNVDIKTSFIGFDNSTALKHLESLLGDKEAAQALKNIVVGENVDENSDYIFYRYVRILTVWDYFLDNQDIHAFLCLFNKHPKNRDSKFDLNIILEYASYIAENKGYKELEVDDIICTLSGSDFEEAKKNILKHLSEGNKKLVISTYQTLGAGQNLQFKIPEGVTPIKINNFSSRGEMDFNAIYLDKPTNLLVNIKNLENKEKDFIKYLFQLEFLLENGAMSPSIFNEKLNQAFHSYIGRIDYKHNNNDKTNLYKSRAFILFINKVIIQALGRICRTNMKSPKIHIIADNTIQEYINKINLPKSMISVMEYEALKSILIDDNEKEQNIDELQYEGARRSNRCAVYIHNQLSKTWNNDSRQQWIDMRLQVLKQPFIERENENEGKWKQLYVELPSSTSTYWYSQTYDYRNSKIYFGYRTGYQEVSQRSSRLTELMEVEELKEHFVENSFATCFSSSKFLLTPPMFNNIYKGALGEVCGKYIIEKYTQIMLKELSLDQFEMFDYKVKDDIYIDFKLWKDNYRTKPDKFIPNIIKKKDTCNARKVLIINILGSPNATFRPMYSEKRSIIEVPFLIQNKEVNHLAIDFIFKELQQ